MKRFLLAASVTAAFPLCASAQEVARVSDFDVVPSVLTSNGKAAPVGFDEEKHEFTIFDGDFNVVKKFNYKTGTYINRNYDEIATVVPSGAKVTDESSYDLYLDGEPVAATTLNEMKQKLKYMYGSDFYGFTDYKGRTSCWTPSYADFYYEECLGTKYPRGYFCIVDGIVKAMHVSYELEINEDAIANAEWTNLDDDFSEHTYNDTPGSFCYLDYDANIGCDDIYIHCSQTLFNDDDKWEYLMPKRGPVVKSAGDFWIWSENSNGIVLRRSVYEKQPFLGCDVINEDGDVVAFFNGGDMSDGYSYFYTFKIAGNLYSVLSGNIDGEWLDIIYKYDPKSTDIKEVGRSKASRATLRVNGRSITVEADGQDVDGAELFDMGGRKLATSDRKGAGDIILNAANAADGVYSVALKHRGRIVGAQKIVLK